MQSMIQQVGWTFFSALPSTDEYKINTIGPGANNTQRVPVEHFLSSAEAENFTLEKVFLERPQWIDFGYVSACLSE